VRRRPHGPRSKRALTQPRLSHGFHEKARLRTGAADSSHNNNNKASPSKKSHKVLASQAASSTPSTAPASPCSPALSFEGDYIDLNIGFDCEFRNCL